MRGMRTPGALARPSTSVLIQNHFTWPTLWVVACPSWGLTAICMIWDQNLAGFRDFGRYYTYTGTGAVLNLSTFETT